MIQLEFIKNLKFSAASGLAWFRDRLYVVSDDQLALEIFSLSKDDPPSFLALLPGELPQDHKQRKLSKPDFEALCVLESREHCPHGALLAVPSGSTSKRTQGALVLFDQDPQSPPKIQPIDLTDLYLYLSHIHLDLNIEGAILKGPIFKLFQRGNGASGQNAVINLNSEALLKALFEDKKISANCYLDSVLVNLPDIGGIPYSLTDAASPDMEADTPVWFLAAAEDSPSTFDDGLFAGAALGCLNSSNQVTQFFPLNCSEKPEGLWIDSKNPSEFYIVTDADNPAKPSRLLRGQLPIAK